MRAPKHTTRLMLAGIGLSIGVSAIAMDCPIGWAAVNAMGQNGTTGGGAGAIVHVSTKSAFVTYAGSSTPHTIIIDSTTDGSWTSTTTVSVKSHKTIIGAHAGVVFDGFGLDINGQSNIILRNLTIKNAAPDGVAVRNSHHIWVDHCDLSACDDGLLDFTVGSDYGTISWTKFHHHDKVTLANSGTGHFEDVGRNRVTYHHNWFYDAVQRNPRIGYGQSHVFNNYYTNISSYCVGFHTGASVLVESNYFQNSANPLQQSYSSTPSDAAYADAKSVGNLFVTCTGTTSGTGASFDPETHYTYKFATDPAANILSVVRASAGPLLTGATNVICPTPAHGAIDVTVESGNLQWTDLEGVTNWDVYFGMTSSPAYQTNKTARAFNPGTLAANTEYFWKVVAYRSSGVVTGEVWRFRTAPTNASKPFPANNELHAPLRISATASTTKPVELTWTPGIGVVSNKVYFGTNAALTGADYKGVFTSPLYAPGPLKYGQTYYWRVDTVKPGGITVTGATWNFKSDVTYSTVGRTEAENMVRSGRYFKENDTGWFPASQAWTVRLEGGEDPPSPGTVSSVWAGSNSICNVTVQYFDENDGAGWYGFYVNETKITEWFASANDEALHTKLISNVSLNTGDELRIAAYSNLKELNRTDCMDVEVVSGGPMPPAAPFGLLATAGDAQVWLDWTASAGATGYIVKRSTTNGGPYASIVTNAATSCVDTGLVNGTTYYYVVSATNNAGQGANSSQVSAMPMGGGSAALYAYEGFNYPPNTSVANQGGGTGWGATWGNASDPASALATNVASGLSYGNGAIQLATSGGGLIVGNPSGPSGTTAQIQRQLSKTLTNILGGSGSVWISFLYQNLQTNNGSLAGFRETGLRLMSEGTTNAAGYSNRDGSSLLSAGSPNTYSATGGAGFDELSLFSHPTYAHDGYVTPRGTNTTNVVFVVVRLDVNTTTSADAAYAWFFQNGDGLSSEPGTGSPLVYTTVDLSGVNALRFQAGNANANGTNSYWALDEIRVGGTFADVSPVIVAGNTEPVFTSTASNQIINVGVNLSITNTAGDADAGQTLTYSLPVKPTNATINASSGVVSWRPLVSQATMVSPFSVVVTDNGTPSLSATQTFSVTVNPLTSPTIDPPLISGGQVGLTVNGQAGPDYAVQGSTNLMDWQTLWVTNPATMPFTWSTNTGALPAQFYRIKVGPPLP
jgi:pectate lyase